MNNISNKTQQNYINKKSLELYSKFDDSDFYYDEKNLSGNNLDIEKKYNTNDFWYMIRHRNDNQLNLGFEFREQIFMRTLSPILFYDTKRAKILQQIDKLFSWMVDHIKTIKKTYNFALDKNYRNFN
jgi:hypothetical protein